MVLALAVIVTLGVGVPIAAWSWTRLRPPPAPPGSLCTHALEPHVQARLFDATAPRSRSKVRPET